MPSRRTLGHIHNIYRSHPTLSTWSNLPFTLFLPNGTTCWNEFGQISAHWIRHIQIYLQVWLCSYDRFLISYELKAKQTCSYGRPPSSIRIAVYHPARKVTGFVSYHVTRSYDRNTQTVSKVFIHEVQTSNQYQRFPIKIYRLVKTFSCTTLTRNCFRVTAQRGPGPPHSGCF